MDGNNETTISYVKVLKYPSKTTIKKLMFQVSGVTKLGSKFLLRRLINQPTRVDYGLQPSYN